MKAELLQRRLAAPIPPNIPTLLRELMQVLAPGLPEPNIKVQNNASSPWLGRCEWRATIPETTLIQLQKSITGDEQTLKRILAHELAHHEDFLLNYATASPVRRKFLRRISHGPAWQAIADRFNARYGPDFVTPKSDEAMVVENTGHQYYVLIKPYTPGNTILHWAGAVRPSPKQKALIKQAVDFREARLFRSGDRFYAHHAPIGQGWYRPTDEDQVEKIRNLYENGTQVAVA